MYSCRFLLIFENQSGIDKHETKKNTFSRCRTGVNAECLGTKSKRYYVAKPGTLVELMTEAEANEITQLTLQGKLNAVDFRHLRDEFKTCNCWTFPMPPSACMQARTGLIQTVFMYILPIAFRHMPSASKWTTVHL